MVITLPFHILVGKCHAEWQEQTKRRQCPPVHKHIITMHHNKVVRTARGAGVNGRTNLNSVSVAEKHCP